MLKFPNDPLRREMWVDNLGRPDFQISKNTYLCSRHFLPDSFDGTGERVWLKRGTVPTIFTTKVCLLGLNNLLNHKLLRNFIFTIWRKDILCYDTTPEVTEGDPQEYFLKYRISHRYFQKKIQKRLDEDITNESTDVTSHA